MDREPRQDTMKMRRTVNALIFLAIVLGACVPREPRLYLIPHPATSQPTKLPAGMVNV